MTENISLSAFCKTHGLSKGSVHKFLKAEGFDTSKGLTPDALTAAKAYFLDNPTEPTAIVPTVIEVGNHRGQLALPQAPAAINLADYRGDVALTSFEPEDVDRFLSSCDGFLEAVEADYHQQQAITQRKAQQAAAVKAKVEQVKEASLVYKLRSEQLALHNAAMDAQMQRDMSVLGKPQQPAASPQP
ncbi:hypothetical protein [Phormidium sp. FACHB-1136]|uniref:hypothetical protein n=1 Tax=Phormidium sp. FACHB-1136 TaxID=2692848 RepID=UPI0016871B9D|nr:hypothetical protein [Phormidium sp. FACHB-1136]MBD2428669.1 hypothetical protein [Phormidium sp. FACHB-1136]